MNNWGTTGGVDQFVEWSPTASAHQHFFTDAGCRAMYRASVAAVINRVNSISGRRCLLRATSGACMHALRCPGGHVEYAWCARGSFQKDSASVLHSCTGIVTTPRSLVRPPQGDMLHNMHSANCMHVCSCKHSKLREHVEHEFLSALHISSMPASTAWLHTVTMRVPGSLLAESVDTT